MRANVRPSSLSERTILWGVGTLFGVIFGQIRTNLALFCQKVTLKTVVGFLPDRLLE